MDLSGVDLNLLVSLDLLLEERSVRAAARRAHVTPSAMSHTLQRLRTLLDDEILVRAGREMVITPRAEALTEPLRDLLTRARSLLIDAVHFDPGTLHRAFRIVCTDHVATVLLPHIEPLLRAEACGVDLYVCPLLPETMEDLRTGRVDAAIGVFPDAPPEMRMRRLFADGFVTVARSDHPRLSGDELTLEAFLAEEHILVSPRGLSEGTIDRMLGKRGLSRRVVRTMPQFLSAIWHCAQSDRLLTVSRRLAAAVAPTLGLRLWTTPLPVEDYTLMLVWHPRVDRAPDDAWFRALLSRAAARLEPPTAA